MNNINATTECATCGAETRLWNKRTDGTGYDCDTCRLAVQAKAVGLPSQDELPPGAYLANLGGWCVGVQFAMSDNPDGPYKLLTPADCGVQALGSPDVEWWVGTYTSGDGQEGAIAEFTTLDAALTALVGKDS